MKQAISTKTTGEKVPFDTSKLSHSLRGSNADVEALHAIINEVREDLYERIASEKISRPAFGLLNKTVNAICGEVQAETHHHGTDPSGYPFEKFGAAILNQDDIKFKDECISARGNGFV